MMTQEDLKEATRKLMALLEDPQPGLATWHTFVVQRCREIASFAGVREEAFEEAAKHLEDHAKGYENSAKSTGEHLHEGTYEWRRRDEAIAYNLREKATQIRQMK